MRIVSEPRSQNFAASDPLPRLRPIEHNQNTISQQHWMIHFVQGSAKRHRPGLVNFTVAVAYHFCLSLPETFTQPGRSLIAEPCTASEGHDNNAAFKMRSQKMRPSSIALSLVQSISRRLQKKCRLADMYQKPEAKLRENRVSSRVKIHATSLPHHLDDFLCRP